MQQGGRRGTRASTRSRGRIAPGQKITIRAAVSPGRAFPVRVTAFDVASRIQLTGGIPLGLFRGVRTYTLSPEANGSTGFFMREEYSGPLVALMWRSIPDLAPSFRQFAAGLKREVEAHG